MSCISSNPDQLDDSQRLMASLQKLEKTHQYRTAAPYNEPWFQLSDSTVPILVSAPHACMHERDGTLKMEEEFTGAIARYLSLSTSCYSIYTVYQAGEDPNWHSDSDYKRAIARLHDVVGLQYVIDLHGMLNSHGMGVAVGTMRNQSCDPAVVTEVFQGHGFIETELVDLERNSNAVEPKHRLVVDHPRFTGGLRNQTVTRFASEELGIPSVQIELASVARVVYSPSTEDWPQSYTGDQATIASAVRALEALIKLKAGETTGDL